MQAAIFEALKAKKKGNHAVGAVVVKNEKIIARGGNSSRSQKTPAQHAELVAIFAASKVLKSRHLEGCVLYTTHEPCPMCMAATIWARADAVIYGAKIADMAAYRRKNPNGNYTWRTIRISAKEILDKSQPKSNVRLVGGFMRDECRQLFHS